MIAVLGARESGTGAALLAGKKGMDVFVSDSGTIEEKYRNDLLRNGIPFEEKGHTARKILVAEEVVKSPGIPDDAPLIKELESKKIPVISEIEFAARFTKAKKICVTGSNGKTTTTTLVYRIFREAGLNVGLAGNIGYSFARLLSEEGDNPFEYLILELSSFQLDGIRNFRAETAIITNISRNHMNRYGNDMQKYIDSKFRIIMNHGEDDILIYYRDNDLLHREILKRNLKMRMIPYSGKPIAGEGSYIENDRILITVHNTTTVMFIHELSLIGKHNAFNSMAAATAARYYEINNDVIRKVLSDVHQIEHRTEYVATVKGVDFINDSKSTTVDSTWWALESMNKPVILILGGEDNKGNDWSILNENMTLKVKALIVLGKENNKIRKAFRSMVDPFFETQSIREAVMLGYRLGKKGDVVLLSPGCASFDLFKSFEDRGWQFKKAVKSL